MASSDGQRLGKDPSDFDRGPPLGRANPNQFFGSRTPTATSPPTHCFNGRKESIEQRQSNDDAHKSRNRSKSGSQAADQKNAWAEGIAHQTPLLDSIASLRKSVEAYDKEADAHEWERLSRAHEDIVSLKRRATGASLSSFPKEGRSTAMGNFSTVALEYSKLLDVLMNQCPEYVSLAWGTMKVLLVANINNAKLKQNVEQYLVKIGEQLGLVNQLIYSVPTGKMIEAVALLYAHFSRFLAKALKYYRKSRLSRTIGAFTFPWETKFQPIVDSIDDQLENIRQLAKASHYRATLQTQQFLQLLRNEQEHTHDDVIKMKDEMQQGLQEMFSIFNAAWIQRFDELQQAISPQQASFASNHGNTSNSTQLNSDNIRSETELLEIRDRLFPELLQFIQREQHLRARSRKLTAYDYQQSVGLLKRDEMKAWFETEVSKILWVNSWITGPVDWASSFALNLLDHAAQLPYVTTLVHFCQNRSAATPATTAADLVRSFIFQALERQSIRIDANTFLLLSERCKLAKDSVDILWAILQDILAEAKVNCVWVIIDAIDMLERSYGASLLGLVDSLAGQPSRTVKVFITSRNAGPSQLLSPSSLDGGALHVESATITVPRARHRALSTLWVKHSRRPGRLPDAGINGSQNGEAGMPEARNLAAGAEVTDDLKESDSLGFSECEDMFASSDDDESLRFNDQRPSAIQLQRNKESFLADSDLDLSLEEPLDAQSESNFGIYAEFEGDDDDGVPSVHPRNDQDTTIFENCHDVIWESDASSL